jgi:hypothetical protein
MIETVSDHVTRPKCFLVYNAAAGTLGFETHPSMEIERSTW